MKTLLFSPMWIDGPERLARHNKWVNFYDELTELNYDGVFFVDNASAFHEIAAPAKLMHIYAASKHFPRLGQNIYGYWYRAFRIAVEYSVQYRFDKLLHIDTDAYLLSKRICDHVNLLDSGWSTFWSEMYGFPETSIQIICKDEFQNAMDFFTDGFLEKYPTLPAEELVPFTHVERGFKGDRYGELMANGKRTEQSPDMDYYCQASPETELKFLK